jgi:hypothetical protein
LETGVGCHIVFAGILRKAGATGQIADLSMWSRAGAVVAVTEDAGRMGATAAADRLKTVAAVDPAGIEGQGLGTEVPRFVINGGTMAHADSETGARLPIWRMVAVEAEELRTIGNVWQPAEIT